MLTVSHRQHFLGKWTLINETLSRVYNLNEKENTREEWTDQTDGVKPGGQGGQKDDHQATAYQTQSELYIAMKVWPWATLFTCMGKTLDSCNFFLIAFHTVRTHI